MDAWAAFVAIDEAYYDCKLAREPAAVEFDGVLDRLLDALDQFDDVLQEPDNLALLSILTGTELLKNWKHLLVGPYREVLPWWLDGTLEAAERRIERELTTSVPIRETGWQVRVQQSEMWHSRQRAGKRPSCCYRSQR